MKAWGEGGGGFFHQGPPPPPIQGSTPDASTRQVIVPSHSSCRQPRGCNHSTLSSPLTTHTDSALRKQTEKNVRKPDRDRDREREETKNGDCFCAEVLDPMDITSVMSRASCLTVRGTNYIFIFPTLSNVSKG